MVPRPQEDMHASAFSFELLLLPWEQAWASLMEVEGPHGAELNHPS